MNDTREHLYLAALLHDIGKFYQRADTGSVGSSKYLNEVVKNLEASILPAFNGRYSHKHCLWTAQFIADYETIFKSLTKAASSDLTNRDSLLNLSASHHLSAPQLSDLGKIIKEADCLSSGMDRDSEIAIRDVQDEEETNWDAFKKKRMTSVLEGIKLQQSEIESKSDWLHLPVEAISLTENYFPKTKFDAEPDYSLLWEDFIKDFKFIQSNDYKAFSETFLNLLYKYASCIPASTVNFPDVSLYDHSKTTAALAVCLYDYQNGEKQSDEPFLLIGADFSGIQGYIYQIVSKYAGKNLKGRSFFLRILSDAVVRYLLKQLNLFQANVIYNSGGGFYLLAPNTKSVKTGLEQAIKDIEKRFFAEFGVSLFVAIDSIPLSKDELMHKDKRTLSDVWVDLFEKRDRKKATKFASLIERGCENFFDPILKGGDALRDVITGEEFDKNELANDKELTITKDTKRQIVLGEKLRDCDIMIISHDRLSYLSNIFYIQPAELGFYYYFLNEKSDAELLQSVDNCTVIRFNQPNFNLPIQGKNNTYELQFYGGNEWNGKSFEEMVNPKGEERDFKRLGVLRMDVDNLGSIFQNGILPERATLSRYAALSRSFDYFFSGYLNTIWKETAHERSFIIYSGGDDVFIVGSWDVCIALAKRIREDFRAFTCQNPAFSISGGIGIVSSKYPIMKGAEEAADEEHNAKEHSIRHCGRDPQIPDNYAKNAISFMDFPLNWDAEFPVVERLKNELVRLVDEENEPSSLLSKIMAHAANAEIKEHKITRIKTYWMLTYDLSRFKERTKNADTRKLLDNCITEVCGSKSALNGKAITTSYHPLELWAFAARWAELDIRSKKN
jgi:CRISPR-associated protein Csm1